MPAAAPASGSTTTATALFRAARQVRALASRFDFATFAELVILDEQTNQPIRLAEHHHLFVRILNEYDRAVVFSFVESGKTQLISIGYTLWRLGKDSSLRIALLSRAHSQAVKIGRSIAKYVEQSDELHQVFPGMRPAEPWNERQLTVARATTAKDPSISLFGLDGAVAGLRTDLLVMDDACDLLNSGSSSARRKLSEMFYSEFFGRLTARSQFISVATPYHVTDLNHQLIKNGIQGFRFSVLGDDGAPRWPSRWPLSRISKTRRGMPAVQAARQLDCKLISDETSVFHEAWIARAVEQGAKPTTLSRTADGRTFLVNPRRHGKIVMAVDPAASEEKKSDLSAIAVVLAHPGGPRELLALETGHWNVPTLVSHILDMRVRFVPDAIVVESTGFQKSLGQWVHHFDSMANVIPYATSRGRKSLELRLGDLEVELANARWAFPSVNGRIVDAEVATLAQELLDYTRADDHVPDRIVSVLLALWGITEATERRVEQFSLDTMSR